MPIEVVIRRPQPHEYDSMQALIEIVANETSSGLFAPNPVTLGQSVSPNRSQNCSQGSRESRTEFRKTLVCTAGGSLDSVLASAIVWNFVLVSP